MYKAYLTALALLGFMQSQPEDAPTTKSLVRLAIGRDKNTTEIVYALDTQNGPVADGFMEIDISWQAIADGNDKVLFVQNQNVFEFLEMNAEEVNQFGNVLAELHETGFHFATAGVADQTYRKNITMLVKQDGEWKALNATTRSGIEGFQPLENSNMAVRFGDSLGQISIDDVVDAVINNRPVEFKCQTMTLPKGAVLSPRLADKDANLIMGYVDPVKKVTVTADTKGDKLIVTDNTHKEDVVGSVIFSSLGEDGNVTKNFGTITVDTDSGTAKLNTGLPWRQIYSQPTQQANA